ncbi:hypothetical protein [Marinobacter alkaliphilus]|nr:hypothetical protein PBN92_10185 [Marinobacter alkaliphilus]
MFKHWPMDHPAKRRRPRTTMLKLMIMAGRLVHSGRQWILRF